MVQAHAVTTRDQYLRVSRVGRGSRLNRSARAQAWRVFEEYRTQLAERGVKEVDDAYRDAAALLQNAYLKQVQTEDASLRGVCVVARTRRERDAIADTLEEHDLTHVASSADRCASGTN